MADAPLPEELVDDPGIVLPNRREWGIATLKCPELGPIVKLLANELTGTFPERTNAKRLIDKHGLTVKDGAVVDQKNLKWVPMEIRSIICNLYHCTPFSIHHGFRSTLHHMVQTVYWPSIATDVRAFVQSWLE